MKKLILLLAVTFISCGKNSEDLNSQIDKLKRTNDSLLKITNGLKDKYIFDEAKVKVIPSEKNSNKLGSDYEGTFVVTAYNKSDIVLFSNELNESNGLELVNPKSLHRDYEGYHFKFKLNQKENDIHFSLKSSSKIGRNFDGIIISDRKVTR